MPTDLKRTYGLHLYTPLGSDYRIEIEREDVRTYENGDTSRVARSLSYRQLSQLADQPVTGGPLTITTYADLAALISACATSIANEDQAKEEAAAAARAALPPIPAVSDP